MKKILAVIAAMCMLFGLCAVSSAEGSHVAVFSISTYISVSGEGDTYFAYDEDGSKVKITVGPDALIVNVIMENCEESQVYSGIIDLCYDDTIMSCIGARSYTGGLYVVNTHFVEDDGTHKVRVVFSTGGDITEDGIILSAAFEYINVPEEGEEAEFTLDVEQLCNDGNSGDKNVDYDIPEGEEYTYVYEEPEEPVLYLYGDANCDDTINTADAVVILKHSADMLVLDETRLIQADVNFDTVVNTGDAVLILKYCVGIVTEFTPA